LLDRYGIPTASTVEVSNLEEALGAAQDIGYPVVLKTSGRDHKSDDGGVVVGIADPAGLELAYIGMTARLGPTATVSRQVDGGVEIGLGMVRDPQFGPVVVVSAGGTLIELLRDRVTSLAPLDRARAMRALGRLAVRELLDGHRGRAPADIGALCEVMARFSEMVVDQTGIASIDVNPVIVGPSSAVAVDALVKWS
jgi:hypothetical protein